MRIDNIGFFERAYESFENDVTQIWAFSDTPSVTVKWLFYLNLLTKFHKSTIEETI